ncbi:MAG: KamA family radical SAM protein [Candidatus Rifleibacteriota bacterium]
MTEKIIDDLFLFSPEIRQILVSAPNHENARDGILVFLKKLIEANVDDVINLSGLRFSLRLSCARSLRQFMARRTAAITGFDMVKDLWLLVQGRDNELSQPFSRAFVEDFSAVLAGLTGNSGVYDSGEADLLPGREGALARSEILDELFARSEERICGYKSGLDPEIVEKRRANRRIICSNFGVSETEFSDYHWQLNNIIRDADRLKTNVYLSEEEISAIESARKNSLPFGITPFYASLFGSVGDDYDRAIRAQVIPPASYTEKMAENLGSRRQSFDFMREADTSPVDLVTRRYARIAIFKPYNTCSQICVYCQRNWEIEDAYVPQALAGREKIEKAIKWIKKNPAITEVLVTGGDPLVMKDEDIAFILESLARISTIRRIRIGTRTPVVLPQRFTDALVEILARCHLPGTREISLVTHFEHCAEVTPEAMQAVQKLRMRGMGVYNQAVFTFFNSRRFELSALRKALRLIGVDPYYTFNAKGKAETADYRVPIARLQQEAKEEARLLPGIERTDEPVYNVPGLGKNYLRAEQNHLLLTILPDGRRVYEFHPWEKFIRHARSYIHQDVPIFNYLQRLAAAGEDPDDYRSIYYYF